MTKKKDSPAPPEQSPEATPMAYCGPTLPGAARQYTVYRNGIPAALEKAATENPALKGLILPLSRLPEARKDFGSKSGHIYRLFCLAQAKNAEKEA